MFKMPERLPTDGQVEVVRDGDNHFVVVVVDEGMRHMLRLSHYNAARLVGALSVLAGIPLAKSVAKEIKF